MAHAAKDHPEGWQCSCGIMIKNAMRCVCDCGLHFNGTRIHGGRKPNSEEVLRVHTCDESCRCCGTCYRVSRLEVCSKVCTHASKEESSDVTH